MSEPQAPYLTVVKDAPATVDQLKARYERIAQAVQELRALLEDEPSAGDPAQHLRNDVSNTLANLAWMAEQAQREYDRGDRPTALNTLGAWAAIVQGELVTRLRVWARAVTDLDPASGLRGGQAALIRAWADSLGEGE